MRIRLKKTRRDEAGTEVSDPVESGGQDTPRLKQRDFLKLAGAALGVGLVAQLVSPATPALAADGTFDNVYVNDSVGIGTSTPAAPLDILGNSADSVNIQVMNANASVSTTSLILGVNSAAGGWTVTSDIFRDGGDNVSIWGGGTGNIRLYVDADGRVGIGTWTPNALLHSGDSIQTDGTRMIINGFDSAPGNFWFRTTASEPQSVFMAFNATAGGSANAVLIAPQDNLGVYVNSSGQVGIATGSPAPGSKLDVGGSVAVNGATAIDGTGTALKAYYS